MAILKAKGTRIAGIVGAVPQKAVRYTAYAETFGEKEVEKIAKLTGIYERRVAEDPLCSSDLCYAAAEDLLNRLGWERDSIDLLIFVSQTGDYMLPSSACSLHGRLELAPGCAAFDINLGCSGFVYGLYVAAGMLSTGSVRRALLLVGDTISKVTSPEDRSVVLLFGDAGSATALEFDPVAPAIDFVMESDGKGQNHLIVPAGGFRKRRTPDTCVRTQHPDGGTRSEEDLYMNGGELLSYTMAAVPRLIRETLALSSREMGDVDWFLFHQANRFMIEHFCRKSQIPLDRVPFNLDRFGNTSSVSVPLLIATELQQQIAAAPQTLLMAGFGVGYSSGGVVATVGPTPHIGLVEVPAPTVQA